MRIALDATYSVDPMPSGIAVYSSELLYGLARDFPNDRFFHCYRPKQYLRARTPGDANASRRVLVPPLRTFGAQLFHALNQRVDCRPSPVVISTFHDLFVMTGEYSSPEFRKRFTEQAKQAAKNSDLIIAVSEFTAKQVERLLGVDRRRIRVIPHGVHAAASIGAGKREDMILFVGAIQTRKNVVRLIEAFEHIGGKTVLTLAGAPDGYGATSILERIQKSAARDRIRVTGYISRSEIEDLFSRASIFAFPSLDEGFGIPVLEAMAFGVPVLTSNRSALPEVAGDAALLVNPEDTAGIASELLRLREDDGLRSRLSALGLLRSKMYSWENAVLSTYKTYKEGMGTEATSGLLRPKF